MLNPKDPNDAATDLDSDGLSNLEEYTNGTRPDLGDTDNDQMPDGWEVNNGLNPTVNDASNDPDGDGTSNLSEYRAGTDPHIAQRAPTNNNGGGGGGGSTDWWTVLALLFLAQRKRRLKIPTCLSY